MSNLIGRIGAKATQVWEAVKEGADHVAEATARASCSVYEDQFLCTAARGHEKKERIIAFQEEEQTRMENRQRELAEIRERAKKLAEAISLYPTDYREFYKPRVLGNVQFPANRDQFRNSREVFQFPVPKNWDMFFGVNEYIKKKKVQ